MFNGSCVCLTDSDAGAVVAVNILLSRSAFRCLCHKSNLNYRSDQYNDTKSPGSNMVSHVRKEIFDRLIAGIVRMIINRLQKHRPIFGRSILNYVHALHL